MKPTLVVLAAGMGSRYGGLKQMDGVGPNGEILIDYSVFDAIKSGFGKAVFIIKESMDADFREKILSKYIGKIDTEVVFQDFLGRAKPWGTGHALLAVKGIVNEPFFVISADDYYGYDTFKKAAEFLTGRTTTGEYAVIAFRLGNTLSDQGSVNRGVCQVDDNGNVTGILENTNIHREGGKIISDQSQDLTADTPVSMITLCFTPDFIDETAKLWEEFYSANKDSEKAEFFMPVVMDEMIKSGAAKAKCHYTDSKWVGMTYSEDKATAVKYLAELHADGTYPEKLFD